MSSISIQSIYSTSCYIAEADRQTASQPASQASQPASQPDRQTARQTDRQTDRQAGRQTDRQTDQETGRKTGKKAGTTIRRLPYRRTYLATHTHTPYNQTCPCLLRHRFAAVAERPSSRPLLITKPINLHPSDVRLF